VATKEHRYGPNGLRYTGKWRARVKDGWVENFLGTFATKEEAERVEREFKNAAK
jgi:hypothetical protein